jgi:hypothetical protein
MRVSANLITILLLALIAAGLWAMPRFNYNVLLARQTALEEEHMKLLDKLERLTRLTGGEDPPRRAALLKSLDALPNLVTSLEADLHALFASSSDVLRELAALQGRVAALEAREEPGAPERDHGPGGSVLQSAARRTEPIELSPELRSTADVFSSRGIAQESFESFLASLGEAKLLPGGGLAGEIHLSLLELYTLHRMALAVVAYAERLHITELAEQATDARDYSDVPLDADSEDLRRVSTVSKGAIHARRIEDLGVLRVFRFPFERFPELADFERQRDNARDHLVRDVVALLEKGRG